MTIGHAAGGRRQLRVAETARAVRLVRRLERPDERCLASERDLDVGAAGELEDREGIDRDLSGVDIAGDAGDRDELDVPTFLRKRGEIQ